MVVHLISEAALDPFERDGCFVDQDRSIASDGHDDVLFDGFRARSRLGRDTGMLLILVIASEETMKKTSRKKITSIMGMISIRARLIFLWRICMSCYFRSLCEAIRISTRREAADSTS